MLASLEALIKCVVDVLDAELRRHCGRRV